MDRFAASASELVCLLATIDWIWTPDGFAQVAEASGWTRIKEYAKGDVHRVTYSRDDTWTWTIYSKQGKVYWSDTRIAESSWPTVESQPIDDEVVSTFLAEYYVLLDAIRGFVGAEQFEGDSTVPGYPSKHDTRRIAQWTCSNNILLLGLFQIEINLPLWLAIMLEPASVYPNRKV
jgi:hypothetical protein